MVNNDLESMSFGLEVNLELEVGHTPRADMGHGNRAPSPHCVCVCLAVPACDQADNSDCDRALTLAPFVIQLRALCERSSTHSAFKLLQSAFPAPSILVASCETREPIEVCNK